MIYTHVLNRGGHGVQSPFDSLQAAWPAPPSPPRPLSGYTVERSRRIPGEDGADES